VAASETVTRVDAARQRIEDAYASQNEGFRQAIQQAADGLKNSLATAQQSFDEQLRALEIRYPESEDPNAPQPLFQPALRAADEAFRKARELLEQVERSSTDAAVGAFAVTPTQPRPPEAPPAPPADPVAVTDQLMSRAIGSLDSAMEAIVNAVNPGTTGSQKG
jgi:hypothetical protein